MDNNTDWQDLLEARLVARRSQERHGLRWENHPLSRDPDEIWRSNDGSPAFVYLDDPIRVFAMRRHADPRDDVLVEMVSLSPDHYLSVYNRSGERIDLALAMVDAEHEPDRR